MKKLLIIACSLMLGFGIGQAQAYQGETAAGVNLVYGSEIENLGIGARFQYGIIDHVRAEVGFNYFFEKNHVNWWDVNLNAHYLIRVFNDRLYFYPLAGINYTMATYKLEDGYKDERNHVGLNLGAGIEYELTDHIGVNVEYRHTIVRKVDQGIFGVGLNYNF